MTEIDPFVYVAATRYAILRPLTGASETVATSVLANAGAIRRDAGAASAIRNEVNEARSAMAQPAGFGMRQRDCDRLVDLWDRVVEALAPERGAP